MAEQIFFGDTLILKGEKLLIDNGASDGIIKSKNGTLTIDGNLTVTGITTTVHSETVTMQDNIIVLNSNATGSATEDSGIEIERGDDTNVSILWDETDNKWTVGSHIFVASTFEGNLTGNVAGNVAGNITSSGSTFSGIDINGGTIDGTPIGAVTPVVGTFTTLTATTINGPLTGTVSSIANHDTDALTEGSTNLYYTNARVDSHLNQSNPSSGSVLSWNGADYSWDSLLAFDKQFSSLEAVPTTITGYGITDGYVNSDVDTHLNQSNPTSGYVLSWNGTDYSWVIQSGGSSYGDTDVASYLFGNLDTHIIPDTNDTYDIGSASFKIRDLYVSDNSLHIGDSTLRNLEGNLLINGEDVMDYNNFKNKPTDTITLASLKSVVAESSDFTDFQTRIAAL